MDISENMDLATTYNIFNIPRLLIFNKNAKPSHELKGLVPESEVTKLLNSVLGQ